MNSRRGRCSPRRIEWSANISRFDNDSIIAITCSATPSLLPPAWFTAATPALVQSSRLTVS